MARTIQSPGVQISEVDLSLRANLASNTNVLIPGFAPKGPSSDPVQVSTLSEFEQIFGLPTNAAERYFYHTAKAVFSSPANVTVYRLPYGDGAGLGTSNQYSALVYPAVTVQNGASATSFQYSATATGVTTYFGAPTHVRLSEADYLSVLRGDAFTWNPAGSDPTFNSVTSAGTVSAYNATPRTTFNTLSSLGQAGLIILNKSQASINNRFEGTYVGIVDNTALNPATSFDDINNVLSINSNSTYITPTSYVTVPSQRLTFALSATSTGLNDSISEVVENIATFDTSTVNYNDTVNIGVFKLRQSTFSPDTIQLDYVLQEGYNASFDYYRQINSSNGGTPVSYFIETVDNSSSNIITLVNPYISNKNVSGWLSLSGIPNRGVRFLSSPRSAALSTNEASLSSSYGCSPALYSALLSSYGATNNLVALGDYSSVDISTKTIGSIPTKLGAMFNTIENSEIYPLSITCEAGLGTIYANSFNTATSGYFDDSVPYVGTNLNSLTAQDGTGTGAEIAKNYRAVATQFIDFATNRRKDHIFIADPLTNIFVQNGVKTLDDPTKNFSDNIYWPLRNLFSFANNSYTATYANVVQVADVSSNRQVWVPSSGFAAAIMGNVDSNYQPWVAPAGFNKGTLNGITDLALYPKQKQRDQLYKISLNPIVFFPNEGFVVYGQKTLLKQPSAFDRINVRRLFLTLETQTNTVARNFVFEPNTLFTRTQVKNVLAPIFNNAKNTAGLYDYLLICDERNNTPSIVDDNTLVIDIYIKPVRTAEFILVNFYATRTSQNFSEIIA